MQKVNQLLAMKVKSSMSLSRTKWTEEEVVRLFEILIDKGAKIISHPTFIGLLDRDQNLFKNQAIREANKNIEYRSVDFEIDDMTPEEFWARIDNSPYQKNIYDRAAHDLARNAEDQGIC